ncbi:unnamed protein product [Ectocarpus sp. 8 AP-2014]
MPLQIRCGNWQVSKMDTVNGKVDKVDGKVDTVTANMDTFKAQVDRVDGKVDTVTANMDTFKAQVDDMYTVIQRDQEQKRKEEANDKHYLPDLASLFNTKTGVCAWCPVKHTHHNTSYEVVVLCMPLLLWYNGKGRPDAKLPEIQTREYFMQIQSHTEIPYQAFCAILEQTPFKPRQVNKQESWNRTNFLMMRLHAWKEIELRNENTYPARHRTLSVERKKHQSFRHFGNNIAYTQCAPGDTSTGYYQAFDKSFTREEKALTPSMGRTWTKEMLDKPVIRSFFDIPEELRGKCHIVGGKLQQERVQTHAAAYATSRSNVELAMTRRLKRAEFRIPKSTNTKRKR